MPATATPEFGYRRDWSDRLVAGMARSKHPITAGKSGIGLAHQGATRRSAAENCDIAVCWALRPC